MKKLVAFVIAATIVAVGAAGVGAGQAALLKTGVRNEGQGIAAMKHAAQAKKYLFVFFYKNEDKQTRAMRKVFDGAMKKVADRAESVAIDVTDPSEKKIVDKVQVSRAPMPLVLAMAPNGVVTKGLPVEFDEKQLTEAFATPTMEKCLKALQGGKNVFVCVQNGGTKKNDAAMKGVRGFAADARYSKKTEILALDPTNAAEAKFLEQFKIDPKTEVAVTLFLAPPAKVIGTFKGATDKGQLAKALAACGADCKSPT